MEGFRKTYFTVGLEYLILIYADLYRGVVKGFVHLIVTVGVVIFALGVVGMVPGVMSWLEQLVLPIILSFSFWSGIIIFGLCGGVKLFCSKFVVKDVVPILGWMINSIEMVSVCARPVVMSVRLSVNMILGAMVIFTLGAMFVHFGSIIFLVALGLFFLYEIGVCFFQSYVFVMLLGLYMSEVGWSAESWMCSLLECVPWECEVYFKW
uniref:ATP synthase subunit a n=1 Tax=Anadara antiquata TaxID=142560 RepID=A0A516IDH1_9BIVA|nr:ATP synthase F0 subunit 6 [Anadara antiquata]